jgi:MipA family protein
MLQIRIHAFTVVLLSQILMTWFVAPANADEVDDYDQSSALYEVGIAAGVGQFPDYPGSNQARSRALVLPYGVYRGSILRSDQKEGTRARIIRNEDIDFDFSASGSFPASSSDNEARRGMPDLDWLGELGPRIEIIAKRWDGKAKLRFLLPLRAVFSTNFSNLIHRGFTLIPGIALDLHHFPVHQWTTYLKFQGSFIDDKLARYFFEVEPHYALADRPAYSPSMGFLETDFLIGVSAPLHERIHVYGGYWATSLQGSANRASPLMKSAWNESFVLGLTYLFYQSQARGHM